MKQFFLDFPVRKIKFRIAGSTVKDILKCRITAASGY